MANETDDRMKDVFGVSVDIGDMIVYPGRQGANVWLNKAKVLDVGPSYLQVEVERANWNGTVIKKRKVRITASCKRFAIVKKRRPVFIPDCLKG
jgi:hypothetical protein